jgi:uncharacterized membrane protein
MSITDFLIIAIPLAFSIVGSIIIIYGGILAAYYTLMGEVKRKKNYYALVRIDFTSKIALGLEFFIAGDLIKTILEPGLNEILTLAIIVGIRTIIGYTLSKESKELEEMIDKVK